MILKRHVKENLNHITNAILFGVREINKDEINKFIQEKLFDEINESIKHQSEEMGLAEALAEKKSSTYVRYAFKSPIFISWSTWKRFSNN